MDNVFFLYALYAHIFCARLNSDSPKKTSAPNPSEVGPVAYFARLKRAVVPPL